MNRAEALRSIRDDLLEYIQSKVKVDYDNARQRPVSFVYGGETYRIDDVLGQFMIWDGYPINGFLVSSNEEEVYFLYFQPLINAPAGSIQAGYWILSFRVLNDNELMSFYREDRKMLLNMTFKRVVDFHGRLCPDLVLGGKFCEYVQKLISANGELVGGLSIIAENCTSALDAIQILLGATAGNQRLQVIDFGKHSYTLLTNNAETGFKFSLRQQHYGDEDEYNGLEQKIMSNQVMLEEVVQFQKLLDGRVQKILALSPEELFEVVCIEKDQKPVETASVYLTCDKCGHQVLKSRKIDYQNRTYCIPCFRRISTGCKHYSLQ